MKPDIIFIGAGPIGLLGAIQVKLLNPSATVFMFEKYKVPVRNHAMYVNANTFKEMERSNGFGEVLDNIPEKVLISDLEITLRQYADQIGIAILYQEIKSVAELKQQYPSTKYIIGSGGLKGVIHPQVFNNENQINENIRYAAEVKYKVQGKAKRLSKLTEIPGILAYTNHLVSEYVGHEKNGVTPVALRIFITQEAYESMKQATFRSPYTMADKDKIDPDLFTTIEVYKEARKTLANEVIDESTLKISMLTLNLYASKFFYKKEGDVTYMQIGEEAFACPFYRSFNDNAYCIPAFAKTITALLQNKPAENREYSSSSSLMKSSFSKSPVTPLESYQQFAQNLVNREIMVIHTFDYGISMLQSSVATSQAVPSFSASKLRAVNAGGKQFIEQARVIRNHQAATEEEQHQLEESKLSNSSSCCVL